MRVVIFVGVLVFGDREFVERFLGGEFPLPVTGTAYDAVTAMQALRDTADRDVVSEGGVRCVLDAGPFRAELSGGLPGGFYFLGANFATGRRLSKAAGCDKVVRQVVYREAALPKIRAEIAGMLEEKRQKGRRGKVVPLRVDQNAAR